jgi:hypothetical protein
LYRRIRGVIVTVPRGYGTPGPTSDRDGRRRRARPEATYTVTLNARQRSRSRAAGEPTVIQVTVTPTLHAYIRVDISWHASYDTCNGMMLSCTASTRARCQFKLYHTFLKNKKLSTARWYRY